MANEEECKSEATLNDDSSSIALSDANSTFNSTNNKNILTQTVKAKSPMVSKTNVRKRQRDKHGTTPGPMDRMWLDKMLMITIVSFSKPSDKHRTQCNDKIGESFQVHTEVGMISKEGLHCHQFSEEFIKWMHNETETQSLGTVEDNMIGRTKQQKEKAKEARKSHHTMGAPTVRNFKHIIRSNQMSDCPVTLEDIDRAENICGKDILHIKGKQQGRIQQPLQL